MKEKMVKWFFVGFSILLIFLLGRNCGNISNIQNKPITDTLILHKVDTIRDTTTIFKIKEHLFFALPP